MALKISVLLENSLSHSNKTNKDLVAKPGLSLLIEDELDSILFDTGPDASFLHNARTMGISIENLSAVVLSHGHYDHVGGVPWLPENTKIICHPAINSERYAEINLLGYVKRLKKLSAVVDFSRHRTTFTCSPVDISDKFIWSGEIYSSSNKSYGVIGGENKSKDFVIDEGVLIYKSTRGLIIFTGCGHRGIINIIRHCKMVTGINKVHALIGGFHLRFASPMHLLRVRRFLQYEKIDRLMGCHCTGYWGNFWLPEVIRPATGDVLTFE